MESKTSDPGRVNKILHYVHLGYLDYIASRTLLLTPLPLQGGVLASTALEKYFKAIITVSGKELRGHLQDHHVEAVREYVPKLYERLNDEFLKFLERCYKLRYYDNLEPGFTLKVYARETLAEIDYTFYCCENQLNLYYSNGRPVRTAYREAVFQRSPTLYKENYVLLNQSKAEFLTKPDSAFAILNRRNKGLLEVEFTVPESPKDGLFNRPGIWRVR